MVFVSLITNMIGDAMLRSGFAIDETSAPAITPDLLGEMKKQDMKRRRWASPVLQDRLSSAARMDARCRRLNNEQRRSTMLKRFRVVGLCLVAVFALSAVAASSASAFTTFKAKLPTGGTFPASVTGTGGEQVFTDETGGTPVKCTAATATGVSNSTPEPTTIQKVKYTGCKASIDNVHEIVAEYKIHANGEVDIVNPIAIKVEGIGACEIVVGAQEKLKLL